jgi:hypothetical protein
VGERLGMIKPYLRPVRDYAAYAPFRLRAACGSDGWRSPRGPVFLIGCGRSGTTLLGDLLAIHQDVYYLYEPRERWAAVDLATDAALAFVRHGNRCFMGESWATDGARRRFARVMNPPTGKLLVEKSPTNSLRIGFLDGLADGARFIHIVRDGTDVVRSIVGKAGRTRRVMGRGMVNDWWGSNDSKWTLMRDEGAATGYYPNEVGWLDRSHERASYEWLVSLREADRWRSVLGERLFELTYRELTESPSGVLRSLAAFMGIPAHRSWIDHAVGRVDAERRNHGPTLTLPPNMSDDFNAYQLRYGFRGTVYSADAPRDANASAAT